MKTAYVVMTRQSLFPEPLAVFLSEESAQKMLDGSWDTTLSVIEVVLGV
jgi:hypothetical protein